MLKLPYRLPAVLRKVLLDLLHCVHMTALPIIVVLTIID